MNIPTAPATPFGPSPLRRTGSIRRTATLDTVWPEGFGRPSLMHGRARDLFTLASGATIPPIEDWLRIRASPARDILEIETSRGSRAAQGLRGLHGGGHLREAIGRMLPEERRALTPLHLLLDDFSGASLVANWAWSLWLPDWRERLRSAAPTGRKGPREGVCSGFRPGSTALTDGGEINPSANAIDVAPLLHRDDPVGWHEVEQQEGVGMRRARRLDVWLENGQVRIDAGFQDSATRPGGGRAAVHEYHVRAAADARSFLLERIEVVPCILPYGECLAAAPNAKRLVGLDLPSFRTEVPTRLGGMAGCTHLNDVLRSLADVPALAVRLEAALAQSPTQASSTGGMHAD